MKNLKKFKEKQRGATLLISLVLLLLLTLLAISASRTAGLQQRMSGNLQQQSSAFQAAESGIRAAILQLNKLDDNARDNWEANSLKSLCSDTQNGLPVWTDGVCNAAASTPYYQTKVKRLEDKDCEENKLCFHIESNGNHNNSSVKHIQGYVLPINDPCTQLACPG